MSESPTTKLDRRDEILGRLRMLENKAAPGENLPGSDAGAGPASETENLADAVAALYAELDEQTRAFKRQRHQYNTITETMREIALKALDMHRFEQYTLNTIRGQFGVLKVFFFRQADYGETQLAVHTARLKDVPTLRIEFDSDFGRFLGTHVAPIDLAAPPEEIATVPELAALRELGLALALPLVKRDEVGDQALMGMIGLGPRIGKLPYGAEDREFLGLLGSMIGVTLYNAHLYQRSIIDNLTQVFSRGHFDIHLEQEIARAQRFNEQVAEDGEGTATGVTLVMLDIDHFKSFNDRYGHQVGDLVLQHVAAALKRASRAGDVVCRYGGEEFGLIFPDVTADKAVLIAERIRKAVESMKVVTPSHGELAVTISLGAATYPRDALETRRLIASADAALYEAKRGGRNRVVQAEPLGPIQCP